MPHLSTAEIEIQAAKKLTLVQKSSAIAVIFSNIEKAQLKALPQLATIFKSIHDSNSKKTDTTTNDNENTINAPHVSLPRLLNRGPSNKEKKCEQLPRVVRITSNNTKRHVISNDEPCNNLIATPKPDIPSTRVFNQDTTE